jgi:hypothetical protein
LKLAWIIIILFLSFPDAKPADSFATSLDASAPCISAENVQLFSERADMQVVKPVFHKKKRGRVTELSAVLADLPSHTEFFHCTDRVGHTSGIVCGTAAARSGRSPPAA